jgi:hypothetical protein
MNRISLAEIVTQRVDWSQYRIASGNAAQFGETLLLLIRCGDSNEARKIWTNIENFVFSQNTVFSAAEPAIDVILAALVEDCPRHVKIALVDLLFLLLNGRSDVDPGLYERCRERALRGVWLLTREAAAAAAADPLRDAIIEVVDLIDSAQTDAVQGWLAS